MAPASSSEPTDDERAARQVRIGTRTAERSLALMLHEFQRAPVPVMCADLFLAYLAQPVVGWHWALLWFAVGMVLQLARYAMSRRLQRHPPRSAQVALSRLTTIFAAIGFAKALILPVYFAPSASPSEGAFLATMVVTGLAAGGVASAAGRVRGLVAWGAPLFAALIGGWLVHGGGTGLAVAVLLVLLFAILLAYVRDQGRMIEELVTLLDDRETLSASLRHERDRAQAASDAKTRFFAAASHDLRQPLHALAINATTLGILAKRGDNAVLQDVSRGISGALSQSQSLLDALLDISRLDAHAAPARKVPVELVSMLRTFSDEYAAYAAGKGIELQLRCAQSQVWCSTDPDHLRRVIANLVNNALKFTTQGSVTTSIVREGDNVALTIQDTGCGIPEDERERVFEEFYQVGNRSRDRSLGLGLGLAIVKRTCELLEVPFEFTSQVDVGTVATLHLEATSAPQPQPDEARVRVEDTAPRAEEFTGRALVIDDEEQVVSSVGRLLATVGWTSRTGTTGAQAQRILETGYRPDVLVVDFRLRDESGLDVIARLRTLMPSLPAVIITGDTAPERLQELSTQVNAVLHKPIDGHRLIAALREAAASATEPGRG